MTASLIQNSHGSVRVAKRDEMLAKQLEMPRFGIPFGQIR